MERSDTPVVACVIPARDPGAHLRETLDSIVAQTYRPLDVVVVDDGSSEDLSWIRAEYPMVEVLRQPALGVAIARNTGIAATTSELVAFCDADDLWYPTKLARQVERFAANPELVLCDTGFAIVDEDGRRVSGGFQGYHRTRWELLQGCGICVSTVVVRRSALLRAGLFDPKLDSIEDWDAWIRLAALGQFDRVEEELASYRVRPGSVSSNHERMHRVSQWMLRGYAEGTFRTTDDERSAARLGAKRARALFAEQAVQAARAARPSERFDGWRVAARISPVRLALAASRSLRRRIRRAPAPDGARRAAGR